MSLNALIESTIRAVLMQDYRLPVMIVRRRKVNERIAMAYDVGCRMGKESMESHVLDMQSRVIEAGRARNEAQQDLEAADSALIKTIGQLNDARERISQLEEQIAYMDAEPRCNCA